VSGLIGPGDRKSIQPMAKQLALGDYDQLHQFIAAGVWDAAPLETELLVQADRFVGGSDAVLVIDDTAIPKKGAHSVGVAARYASAVGKHPWPPRSATSASASSRCGCAKSLCIPLRELKEGRRFDVEELVGRKAHLRLNPALQSLLNPLVQSIGKFRARPEIRRRSAPSFQLRVKCDRLFPPWSALPDR
jgi:SRSO17 transposase